MQKQTQQIDRAQGCLLAGASGDALGAPVEFSTRTEIIKRFGPHGINNFVSAYGRIGAITDDTQMTLFTAEACLRSRISSDNNNRSADSSSAIRSLKQAYQRWLWTQSVQSETSVEKTGWLIGHTELFNRRAPGNTCLSALRRKDGEINDSKGCGGIMRVAPCGILHAGDPVSAYQLGLDAAKLTHGHPTGYLSAAVFAAMIAELMAGNSLPGSIQTARAILLKSPDHAETLSALDAAVRLATAGQDHLAAISELGEGWIAEEALAISVYCALVAEDLEHGITLAVNITGDSDSTGSITGNLLGAISGVKPIPQRWLEPLELRDVIATVAKDIVLVADNAVLDAFDQDFIRRYPPDHAAS